MNPEIVTENVTSVYPGWLFFLSTKSRDDARAKLESRSKEIEAEDNVKIILKSLVQQSVDSFKVSSLYGDILHRLLRGSASN